MYNPLIIKLAQKNLLSKSIIPLLLGSATGVSLYPYVRSYISGIKEQPVSHVFTPLGLLGGAYLASQAEGPQIFYQQRVKPFLSSSLERMSFLKKLPYKSYAIGTAGGLIGTAIGNKLFPSKTRPDTLTMLQSTFQKYPMIPLVGLALLLYLLLK